MSTPFTLPGLEHVTPVEEPRTTRRGPSPDELLEGLNEPQRAAVVHAGAPLLVVAGAGSGKTRVLTRRIAWLITERKAHPGSILAITFTNKAAAEMKERVEDLVGKRARIMWVSTFHSACVRILRKEITALDFDGTAYKSNFSIYDAADSKRLMTLVLKDLDLDPKRYQPGAVLHWVSNHKNELRDPEDAAKDTRNSFEEAYAAAYTNYQRRLRDANALDFDDLIMTTVHLFQTLPDVRENYRRRFRHVLVDEYQDTNHAQYALIHQLCGQDLEEGRPADDSPSELMVVGDADQSIYAFRGANIRNILDFEQDFPDATSILLEQNYRSTQTILTAANSVIKNNSSRKDKRLWSDAGDGERIVGYVADDEHDEARFVSEEIDKLVDTGDVKAADVAVFYRTNAQSRVFEEIFIRTGQPYKVVGGVRFYERREVRDALAYLRMLVNTADEISLRRVLNTPKRGIGERAEACVQALAERERISFWEALVIADQAPGLATRSLKNIQALRRDDPGAAVDGRRRGAGRRDPGVGARALGLPHRARGQRRPAGRDPGGEPGRAGGGRPRVLRRPAARPVRRPGRRRGGHHRRQPRRLPRAGGAGRRLRPDPRRPRRRGRRRRHADDAAHRQGAGVPGRLPDRPRGRRLPAPAFAGRPARARGGASAGLRRRHPRPRAALRLPRDGALRLGRAVAQPGVAVHRRVPGRPRRLASHRPGDDPLGATRPGGQLTRRASEPRPRPVATTSPPRPLAPT